MRIFIENLLYFFHTLLFFIIFKSINHVANKLVGLSVIDTSNASTIQGTKQVSKMVNIRCDDYGFDCDYFMEGVLEEVIGDFWEHMYNEHGIEYSKGSIYKSIKKKFPLI